MGVKKLLVALALMKMLLLLSKLALHGGLLLVAIIKERWLMATELINFSS